MKYCEGQMIKLKKVFLFFIFLCILILKSEISTDASNYVDNKHILILNSYQPGFTWTDDQTRGILETLEKHDRSYEISTEYLDWKRYPDIKTLEFAYDQLLYKYQNQKIDLILCTDDAAFQFATKYRGEFLSDAPIVFSGINSEGLAKMDEALTNYTGVLEVIEPAKTIEASLTLNPDIDTLYLIYDSSESGLSTGKLCMDAAKVLAPNLKIVSMNDMTAETIVDTIRSVSKNTMVMITTYSFDSDGDYIEHEQFCEELGAVSPVPLYHIYDFGINKGIFGGYLTIGYLQGSQAALLGIEILEGENADDIPIITRGINQYSFDYKLLDTYGFKAKDLPEGSILINEPFSFYKTYRTFVNTVLLIITFLIVFTLILLFYIRKIKKLQIQLSKNNEELSQLYEELTATEDEIRRQYEELSDAHIKLEDYNQRLFQLAHHDSLTGLFNRLYLYEEVQTDLNMQQSDSAFYFIDLDNFKYINDALGHHTGDELLQIISLRLQKLCSQTNTLIRLGGDEFIFIVHQLSSRKDAELFAKQILLLFAAPFRIQGNHLSITCSVGISLFPEHGRTVDALLRDADMAMYKAKRNGKNGYLFFNDSIREEILERINIERYFQKALTNEEFTIYYQPQIITKTGEIDGFEALIRWDSPELGFLSPYKFITIAEENGFIIPLGEWILRSSCRYIQKINAKFHKHYKISVNISVIQLFQENFVAMIHDILTKLDFPPHLLEIEITESVIMESVELISEKLRLVQALGVRIALDDFGTGYSSMAYLKTIPISTLKVDKIFIDDITNPDSDINLADTIIDLGHKMSLTIVAEGVETSEQVAYLKDNGCDKIQGYYYSKPIPSMNLENWISSR